MITDYVHGGQAFGGVATRLVQSGGDFNVLRPYVGADGRSYISKNFGTQREPKWKAIPTNNAALLRRDDWLLIDEAVTMAAKPALRAVGDLRAAGLVKTIDGLATPVLAYERMSDITGAIISMDGLREGETDRPEIDIAYLPIPIIHKDLSFSAREVLAARRAGTNFDTASITMTTRRVAEEAEKLLLGTSGSYYFGGGTVYGYTNFPGRVTKTMTLPTAVGWTPQTFVNELLDMRQKLVEQFRSGPYVLYLSSNWDPYIDGDYSASYNGNTLRTRVQQIDRITSIRTLDYLTSGYQAILVQMTEDVIQEVIGMDIRAIQWEEKGGMEMRYKIMAIMVPRIRTDIDSHCGICHGVAA